MIPKRFFRVLGDKLDYGQNLPLHRQVSLRFRSAIESGELAPGDALPPEEEICAALEISRSTVRQALASLVEEGLVVRVQGKGTYVSESKIRRRMERVYSFTHEMLALGKEPSSRVLRAEAVVPGKEIAQRLRLPENEKVWSITRVRMADGEPLLVETSYIPCRILEKADPDKLSSESLYDMLCAQGTRPSRAEETYESVIIPPDVAVLMGISEVSAGFFIERCTLDQSGEPYELTRSVMRGDRSKLAVNLEQYAYSVGKEYSGINAPAVQDAAGNDRPND